jgi:sulfoxide reductase heme-binding subunit YedZ
VPVAVLAWLAYQAYRSGDPTEYVTAIPSNTSPTTPADWTIRFLCFTLSITPLRMLLNRPQITRFRRMLGLFAFFYGCLHLAAWVFLDPRQNTVAAIWEDIMKRRYITLGMLAFLACSLWRSRPPPDGSAGFRSNAGNSFTGWFT